MFNSIFQAAEEWIADKRDVPTSIVTMFKERDGKYPVDMQSLNGENQTERQHEILDIARAYANSDEVPWMFLLTAEAWSLRIKTTDLDNLRVSPSQHPERVETFMMSGIDDKGRQQARMYEIVEKDGKRKLIPMSVDEDVDLKLGTWIEPKEQNPEKGIGFHDLMLESLWAEYRILKSLYSMGSKKVE
jgi:hypothetical protein